MKRLTLILFVSLLFFATASYAGNEDLIVEVTEAKNKLQELQDSNSDFKEKLANNENEIASYQLALEDVEAEISRLKESALEDVETDIAELQEESEGE